MKTSTLYTPCEKCRKRLLKSKSLNHGNIRENKNFFSEFKQSKRFVIGTHGAEKAALKDIDLSQPNEVDFAVDGNIIEVQEGKNKGEIKFILFIVRNKETLHYVFLKTPESTIPTLINVYNPREGMTFKWSTDGKRRQYLNSFRSCCPHPEDKEEYYNKAHHGVQHAKYAYQS